jgi:hypothetical protein
VISNNVYGIKGASVLRGDPKPFTHETVYTNDPMQMVKHCLECTSRTCDHGECAYTRTGEGRRKRVKRTQPPAAADVINRIAKMWLDGWRKKMIARELGTTVYIVERSLAWAEKEGLI